jgi:8-oxo-dGTP pyrophosphatase MutT (NUDIX family)
MKHTQSAGGVVLNEIGEVLVVNQNGNSWCLPKGHLDEGEDKLTAAKREIHEESGVTDLMLVKDIGSYDRYRIGINGEDDKTELKTIFMFQFKTNQMALKPTDHNNPEARWVDKDKVVDLLTHVKDKEFFSSIVHKI